MRKVYFVLSSEIDKIKKDISDNEDRLDILSNIFRLNTLSMVYEAGSGHLGSSFSYMDILTWLWIEKMNQPNTQDGDIFFSSKGHDVPALYSVLIGLGILDEEKLHQLRRLGGLPGHPDQKIPGIYTNTGSLGMGISKARGMALANRLNNKKRNIYVVIGDGELQEGQIWESLGQTANKNFGEIYVIVDNNKIQSDTWVDRVNGLGDLEKKFTSFGWDVKSCDGHNFRKLKEAFDGFKATPSKPHILIASTVKGKGVSFMEGSIFPKDGEFYGFHSGAPSDENYQIALDELITKINNKLGYEIKLTEKELPDKNAEIDIRQKLMATYGEELLKIGKEKQNLVVLNADLLKDHALYEFKTQLPERFFECGIAEQDMVSMAGGLALEGKIPVVNSFACFLSTRPNEHIYNNATEKKKIIYVGTLAGLLPATPGHSHQSVRDISILGSIPGLTMFQPATEYEVRKILKWAINDNLESTYIRFYSIPFRPNFAIRENYNLEKGKGIEFNNLGNDVIIFSYSPTMLNEAILASSILKKSNIGVTVVNLPWLNTIDEEWLFNKVKEFKLIVTIDDHYKKFGQGMLITSLLAKNNFKGKVLSLGLDSIPECGQAEEVLKYHKLDSQSIVNQIIDSVKNI